jgi:hypothetical protein
MSQRRHPQAAILITMKLRIKGEALRLRLTQSEVARLTDVGSVCEAIHFGESSLEYEVRSVDVLEGPAADFDGLRIVVKVPRTLIDEWANSDSVSIESEGEPRILIEKDFACLTKRKNEDDADAFPNPDGNC